VKLVLFAVKLAISGVLIWLLLTRVNFAPVGEFLKSGNALTAMSVCVAILIIQAAMAALRFRWIMRLMGTPFSFRLGFSTWMIGLLISQTLVTFVAGDAARIWQIFRKGYSRRLAGSAVFLERILGFAVLMALVLACIPFLLSHGAQGAARAGLLALAGLCTVGILGFIASGFFGRLMARFLPRVQNSRIAGAVIEITSAARHLIVSWKLAAGIVVLSVVMHLCNALAFYILGKAAGLSLDMLTTIAVALPVMLIALMPIALAGWGVREGAAVVGYGLFGVAAETAVTISVAFGLALLIASLPGGLYLWFGRSSAKAARMNTDGDSLAA
jgi:uncharacterized protein (TIRG00374 family)